FIGIHPSARDKRRLLFVCTLFGSGPLLFFFHLLAQLFLALAPDFSPLGALLVNEFFAAQQLDKDGVCAIALAPAFVDDAQIPAVAVAKSGGHGIKQTVHGLTGHEIRT